MISVDLVSYAYGALTWTVITVIIMVIAKYKDYTANIKEYYGRIRELESYIRYLENEINTLRDYIDLKEIIWEE